MKFSKAVMAEDTVKLVDGVPFFSSVGACGGAHIAQHNSIINLFND
jgi:hypothetical protein